jgi:hypothetical protein
MFPSDVEYARYKTMSNALIATTAAIVGVGSIRGSNTAFVRVFNISPRGGSHGSFYSGQLGVARLDYKVTSNLTGGTIVTNSNTVSKSDPNLLTRSAVPEFRSTNAAPTTPTLLASGEWAQIISTTANNYTPTRYLSSWDDTKPLYVLRSNAEWVYADFVVGTSFSAGAIAFYEIEWEEY